MNIEASVGSGRRLTETGTDRRNIGFCSVSSVKMNEIADQAGRMGNLIGSNELKNEKRSKEKRNKNK